MFCFFVCPGPFCPFFKTKIVHFEISIWRVFFAIKGRELQIFQKIFIFKGPYDFLKI